MFVKIYSLINCEYGFCYHVSEKNLKFYTQFFVVILNFLCVISEKFTEYLRKIYKISKENLRNIYGNFSENFRFFSEYLKEDFGIFR